MNKKLSRVCAIGLIALLGLSMTACGGGGNSGNQDGSHSGGIDSEQTQTHTHHWETEWSANNAEHWHACDGCDDKQDKGAHDGDICSVCGYEKTHECTYNGYVYDGEHHWKQCVDCYATTSKEAHSFSDNVCVVCGYEQSGEVLETCELRDLEIITVQDGQGVASLIKLPDGKDMLIDSGCSQYYGMTERLLYDHVEDLTIEYFVLTSTDSYHTGAAASIFIYFNVLNFYRPSVKSGHSSASEISDTYNSGISPYIENCEGYAATLEWLSYEAGCTTYVVDDISCDFTFEFQDNKNTHHSYTIDFIVPIEATDRTTLIDNTVMVSIEYKDVVTLITGYTSNNTIDTYCNTYGTQKDVDVLLTYWVGGEESKYAISRSDLRGTNFLEKINLAQGDYTIIASLGSAPGVAELISEVNRLSTVYGLHENPQIITKVTATGELTVVAE